MCIHTHTDDTGIGYIPAKTDIRKCQGQRPRHFRGFTKTLAFPQGREGTQLIYTIFRLFQPEALQLSSVPSVRCAPLSPYACTTHSIRSNTSLSSSGFLGNTLVDHLTHLLIPHNRVKAAYFQCFVKHKIFNIIRFQLLSAAGGHKPSLLVQLISWSRLNSNSAIQIGPLLLSNRFCTTGISDPSLPANNVI